MRRFLNNLFEGFQPTSSAIRKMKPGRRPAPARDNRARLSLEALENREVPTVSFTPQFSGTGVTLPAGTTLAQEEAPSLNSPNLVIIFAGGWIYFNLLSTLTDFDITNASTELRQYAARIPPISTPRQLFAALLFPVVPGPARPRRFRKCLLPRCPGAARPAPGAGRHPVAAPRSRG